MSSHRSVVLAIVVCAAAGTPSDAIERKASPSQRPTAPRKSVAELAADVVRSMKAFRGALERALPAYEAELKDTTEALEERRMLHESGQLPASYVVEAERWWAAAQRDLDDARAAIDEADRIILEASVHEELARLAPLPRGGYEDRATLVRFNGSARWSLREVPRLKTAFTSVFGRTLPISSFGQTKVHDRLGLDHRVAIDVEVHPDSTEGQWLMQYLRRQQISFIGVRSAISASSTGAHVHVGPPSPRIAARLDAR